MSSADHKFILAIDLGTSGPKAALISTRGEVVDYEFEAVELLLLPHGGAEQRPEDWWQAILKASKKVLAKNKVPVEDIVAINCTSQWSGTVAVDQGGQTLMNAIIWMDSRGSSYVSAITDGLFKIEGYALNKLYKWIRLTGGAPGLAGKDPLAHILYIKDQLPDIYQQTYKFLEPMDYINLCLTGKFAASYDSISLHWVTDNRDINKVHYDDGLFAMATIDRDKLPDLKRPDEILGTIKHEVAEELGLTTDVKVIMGTPDVACAAVGSGAVGDFEGHLYIGTSSWLICHVPFKKTDILHAIGSLPSAIPGRYMAACEQETAGACLNFLRDNILYHKDELLAEAKVPDVYKIFDQIVADVPAGSGKVIFTPWLYGERCPVEDHSVRSGIFNQSLSTTRGHLIRAVFEGVAYNTKWLLRYMEKFVKRRMDPIRMIGGGANSDIWCQIFADVLDRRIQQAQDPIQANLKGAALLAAAALGYITYDEIPSFIPVARTYAPNQENRRIYDELFAEFLNIYKANKKIYARLNKK